jgi:hypothetical protein
MRDSVGYVHNIVISTSTTEYVVSIDGEHNKVSVYVNLFQPTNTVISKLKEDILVKFVRVEGKSIKIDLFEYAKNMVVMAFF